MTQPRGSTLAIVIAVAIGFRLAPYLLHGLGLPSDPNDTAYPWNFSPILPLCLFGAACYASRATAFWAPLAIYLAGDLAIWLLTGRADLAFYAEQPAVYASVALVVACGLLLRRKRSWARIAAAGLGSAVVFFVASNFGVWALGNGARYSLDMAGLADCYVQAIPFFRNTLLSMALFLPLLFSPVALRRPTPAPMGAPGS